MPSGSPVALARVDVGQPAAQRADDVQRQRRGKLHLGRQRAAPDLLQAPAVDELQHQEVLVARLAEVQHLHQVAVVQRRGDVRLVDEHAHEGRIRGQRRQDPLEHDRLLKPLLALLQGQEDLRHSAVGDLADHVVSRPARHRPENTLPGANCPYQLCVRVFVQKPATGAANGAGRAYARTPGAIVPHSWLIVDSPGHVAVVDEPELFAADDHRGHVASLVCARRALGQERNAGVVEQVVSAAVHGCSSRWRSSRRGARSTRCARGRGTARWRSTRSGSRTRWFRPSRCDGSSGDAGRAGWCRDTARTRRGSCRETTGTCRRESRRR